MFGDTREKTKVTRKTKNITYGKKNRNRNRNWSFIILLSVPAKIKASRAQEPMSFSRGQNIRIRVPIAGRPFPKAMWIKDGEVMEQSQRVRKRGGAEEGESGRKNNFFNTG